MSGRRIFPMFFAAAILLLNGGDCISALFADEQAKTCCTRGHCVPTEKADPCCDSSFLSVTKYFQTEGKFTVSHAPILVSAAIADTMQFDLLRSSAFRHFFDFTVHSPPGASERASLPLLI
jgi:hypothetical protein